MSGNEPDCEGIDLDLRLDINCAVVDSRIGGQELIENGTR